MEQLKLRYYGDPVLRKKGALIEQFDDQLRELANAMIEKCHELNGLGLAAPQVGKSLALFITNCPVPGPDDKWIPGQVRVFINPKILEVSEEKDTREEGCLSIPNLYEAVERPIAVRVKYQDLDGKELIEEYSGLEARCIMHENDHVNGVLYIDRIKGKRRKLLNPILDAIKMKYSSENFDNPPP